MDRNELKVQALLEKIGSLTTNYENQLADMRVEFTMLSNQLQAMQAEQATEETDEVSEEAPAPVEG